MDEAQEKIRESLNSGDVDRALEGYIEALCRAGDFHLEPELLFRIAGLFHSRKEYNPAIEAFEQLIYDYPRHKDARKARFIASRLCSKHLGEINRALALLDELKRTITDKAGLAKLEKFREEVQKKIALRVLFLDGNAERKTLDGVKFVIVRQTDAPFDIPELGRAIAKMLKMYIGDVTIRLGRPNGIMFDGMPWRQADKLGKFLDEAGVPVFILEQDMLVKNPPADVVADAVFDPGGFTYKTGSGVQSIPWEEIMVVNGGQLNFTDITYDSKLVRRAGPHGTYLEREYKEKKKKKSQALIDIVAINPPGRFRIMEEETGFSLLGDEKKLTRRESFVSLAKLAFRYSRHALFGKGVAALAGIGNLNDYTFKDDRALEDNTYWMIQRFNCNRME